MSDKTCKSCKFSVQEAHLVDQWVSCHRYPPLHDRRLWSITRPGDWCGEYQPKEVKDV